MYILNYTDFIKLHIVKGNSMFKRRFYFYSITTIFFICIVLLFNSSIYAINIFSNGEPRIYTDEVNGDTFYGGYNLGIPGNPAVSGPTEMTFNVQNVPQNIVNSIIGGSLSTAIRSSTIQGDVILNVANTQGIALYGGGVAVTTRNPAVVTGLVRITLDNSDFVDVYGGGNEMLIAGVRGSTSVGGVNIVVKNSRITNLTGSASSLGLEPQRFAVEGDVNIQVTDGSVIQNLIGTSESSAHIRGNLSIYVKEAQVDRLSCIDHAMLAGNLLVELAQGATIRDVFLSTESNLLGTAKFIVDGAQVTNFNLGPSRRNLNTATVTLRSGTIDHLNMISGVPILTMQSIDLFVEGGSIGNLQLCPNQGVFHQTKLIMSSGNINNVQLGTNTGLGVL